MLARLAAALLCALAGAALAAPNQAATVQLADGEARIETPGKSARPAKPGEKVNEGDVLVTGKDGEIHLAMQDSGFMVVRPATRFQVVSYAADGDDKDKGIFQLIAGGVRSVTGWIGKFNAKSYQIRTSNASIGIRGTDHETRFIPEGSAEGEAGTYDRVYAGETVISADGAETTVRPDESGFQSTKPRAKPRRLGGIPAFYRAGPHEREIAKKHAEIQRIVAERREERRKLLQERREAVGELKGKVKEARESGKAPTDEQRGEIHAQRAALQRDVRAARQLHGEIARERKALEEDVKGRRVTREEARERRAALQEKDKTLTRLQEDINRRLHELNETADSILR